MGVVVTNASSVKALVVTRSLGRKGISVITTDCERFSPTFFSKYSSSHFLSPSAEKSPITFIEALLGQVKRRNIKVLMPINSIETLLISKFKDRFSKFTKVPFDDYSKMIQLHDKEKLMRIAKELDIPIPTTYSIEDISEIRKIAKVLEYPVVIKLKNATSSRGISYAFSEEEFVARYKQTILKYNLGSQEYPLVQEYIIGDGYGVSVLFNCGDLRAIFVHKRLREYPITGGPSTFRVSIRHPEMEKIAVKLLEYMNWHGVAMVEFKLNKRTNKPVLIEVNPRFWGSINQAVVSGVDFPYLLYKVAVEGDVKPVLNYKLGVKTRFLIDDMRALLAILKQTKNPSYVLKELLRKSDCDDVIDYDDILPFFAFLYIGIKKLIKGNKKRLLLKYEICRYQ